MNDFDSINPMNVSSTDPAGNTNGSGGSEIPGAGGPIGSVPPPTGPVGPMNKETNYTRIYQIAVGVVALLLLVALIFIIVYYRKANKTQSYISGVTAQAVDKQSKDDKVSCDQQIKDIRENPWTEYKAKDEFGAFKFIVPRNWSQYEYYDDNANDPYSLYFSPDTVRYDSSARKNHAALEVVVSKRL